MDVTKRNRVEWIDFVRGIAIFIVVLGHVNLGCYFEPAFDSSKGYLWKLHTLIYSFHMPLFFMISGFLYGCSQEKANQNFATLKLSLLKKLISFGVPYFIFSILYCPFKSLAKGDGYSFDWQNLFLQIKPVEYYWFLYILFFIFCIVEILDYVIKNNYIVFFLLLLLAIVNWNVQTGIFSIDETLNKMIYFYLAKLLSQRLEIFRSNTFNVLSILTFIVLSCCDVYKDKTPTFLNFILAISIALPIFSICSRLKSRGIFFRYFSQTGQQTMPIYVLHGPVISLVRIGLLQMNVNSLPLHFVCEIAISWFASIYAYKLLNKSKQYVSQRFFDR